VAKRKSPSPPRPPSRAPLDDPRYEILAEGDPPRPVNRRKKTDDSDADSDNNPPRKSPPRRGPKTAAGKNRSKQNAEKHGLCQDIRRFHVLKNEDPAAFEDVQTNLLRELDPWDTITQLMVENMAKAHWELYRADFYFESDLKRAGGNFIDTATKYERYRASIQRRLTSLQKQFFELRAARQKDAQATAVEAAKRPKYGPDGKAYEVNRTYSISKLSNNPSPRHYIHNFATEKIILSDGKYWFARTIPLVELMEGEFFKVQYGLGNHFQEAFREWRQTNKLYHPGEPYVTKKWPPPVPENCPPDDWFLDQELSLAEDQIAILKQRAERLQMEERAELRRQFEEAREAEAEDQRRELEEELRQAAEKKARREKEEDEENGDEGREDEEPDRDDGKREE
jgi:hypothetical protein